MYSKGSVEMIIEAVKVLLFGMLGIFIIMGVIMLATKAMNRLSGGKKPEKPGDDVK